MCKCFIVIWVQTLTYTDIIVPIKVLDIIMQEDEIEDLWSWPAKWQEIQQLLIFFKPFAEVTNYMSGQSYSTISNVIVQFNTIFNHLEGYTDKSNKSIKSKGPPAYLVQAAKKAHEKLRDYYRKTHDMYCMVTLLDPRCKLELFYQQDFKNSQIENYKKR